MFQLLTFNAVQKLCHTFFQHKKFYLYLTFLFSSDFLDSKNQVQNAGGGAVYMYIYVGDLFCCRLEMITTLQSN